jgi:ABC-type methionine transport system ATPase subunit
MVMERLMAEHRADRTMIVIAHRISTLKDSDKVAVFDQGLLVEQGRFQELAEDPQSHFGKMCAIQSLEISPASEHAPGLFGFEHGHRVEPITVAGSN